MNRPGVVVFDTGSNWLAMTSTLCKECDTKVFDVENSETAKLFDEEEFDQSYGSASLSGYVYHDTVCLHSIQGSYGRASCVDDFTLMAITE